MNVATWVDRNGRIHSDRPALSVGARVVSTHRQFAARVRSIAGFLRGTAGCAIGDRAAIVMANSGNGRGPRQFAPAQK
jgi:acyl-CoA synthetase (AMP-forming)/AMP-acid ligase II